MLSTLCNTQRLLNLEKSNLTGVNDKHEIVRKYRLATRLNCQAINKYTVSIYKIHDLE